ncbi:MULTISPECIES: glutamate-5-semialdehyde dehydrogenase [Bacillaceae]|uniref:Gamma-glutamyl phosphate reductase n=1 Tax=Evansella alkalicola TaxID=745819 RepID=A0ABS6JW61_9BACI|nr:MULTISPECIES: glutamate-5-semialdehyde dehydrogenase [Bacillaceae]MBU9721482.1 glutamate-5-semialdehyde dehydrogenase [Bacillus alkalicola]
MSVELVTKAALLKDLTGVLGATSSADKNDALLAVAKELLSEMSYILEENKKDLLAASEKGFPEALLDRLKLTEARIKDMSEALTQLTELKDPIGEVISETTRPNGLKLNKVRVPLGVIGMIYEARPNVTIDAASLCLKTGNAVLLRGSSSASHSNKALVKVIHKALEKTKIPKDAVQLLEDTSRETAEKLFTLNEYLDVLIPRGGANLIKSVMEKASVPVIETGVGNCHVFIDNTADKNMAIEVVTNAKTQRPSVCNAAETVIVHKDWAKSHLTDLVEHLVNHRVTLKGDHSATELDKRIVPATEEDWNMEYLDLILAVKIVSSVDEAINHIKRYGTKHSESIISRSEENVKQFMTYVDAAAVYHNASTRFTDGFEFGFGAEIGISTQKLHARGPMGLEALTSTKYLIYGEGQTK